MKVQLRSTVAAIMLLVPVAASFVAQPAAAQQRAATAPSITNMALNSDAGLSPGATLRAQVVGTPNAKAGTLQLGDSGIRIQLRQQGPGSYTGSYVIRRQDRIDPTQLLTARLTYGTTTYTRQFNYPTAFQALAMGSAPAAAPRMEIERFVMRPMGAIEPGRELRFRLRGAPGGDAWADIPGVINGVDLAEVRPGIYEGTYTVRRRDNPDAFRNAVATLRQGNQRVTARLDLRGGDDDQRAGARDERSPDILDMMPANGERVGERGRTRIGARLADEGSGVDPNSVRMRLNGRDVTADARVSPGEITYRADLEPGRYTAEIQVRDVAGNSTRKAWTFDVTPGGERGDRGDRRGAGPLPLEVTSHSNNMVIDASGNLAIQGRTVPNATVRVQVDSVANVAGAFGLTQPVADQTVQADRNGYFSVAVSPRGALPIPGTRFDVRVTSTSGSETAEERLSLMQRRG